MNGSLARIEAEIAALEDEQLDDEERQLCADSLASFARMAWPVLEPATELKWDWPLDVICEWLEDVTEGRRRRVLMNVPPGSMKSLLTGVIWPAWEWGPRGMPSKRFLATAHMEKLALRDNMKCRRLIQSAWYQRLWPVALTSDQNAKGKFENAATGFREAMAFTSMTGSRGDRVILDDPHSVDDANSVVKLDADILTFREALPSRVNNDDSAIVIIMQRLHEKDISAVAAGLGYDHLVIPMRYEPERPGITWRGGDRSEGALMFPARFSETAVQELERSLGPYATAGQLQQRPAPREGGLFKRSWFGTLPAIPAGRRVYVRAWDLAATKKATGNNPDWTAGVLASRGDDGVFLIEHVERLRGSPLEVVQAIRSRASTDPAGTIIRIPQDPGQAGKAQAETFVRDLAGYSVKTVPPTGDKATRATPAAAQAEVGNIKLLVTGETERDAWIEPFLSEVCLFPAASHDDQVDALSDAINELALGGTRYDLYRMLE